MTNQIIDGKVVQIMVEEGVPLTETASTEVTVRSLVVPKATLESYTREVITEARTRIAAAEARLREVEDAQEGTLARAERALRAAEDAGSFNQQRLWRGRLQGARSGLTRRRRELETAKHYLSVVEEGYLPIPRLPAVRIGRLRDPLPPEVLEILADEQRSGRFEEFQVVGGRDVLTNRTRRQMGRDPILVGICDGEMFPLAWWR